MNNITTLFEWRKVARYISNEIYSLGYEVIDWYLVGSKVMDFDAKSDFDSIVIVKNVPGYIFELKALRLLIEDIINRDKIDKLFHFKLFSESEFSDFTQYDGYRFADFKLRNESLFSSGIMSKYEPNLTEISFRNSILIQIVYNYHRNRFLGKHIPTNEFKTRIQKWLKFNKQFNSTATFERMLEAIVQLDPLIHEFWMLIHSPYSENTDNKLQVLMSKYYGRIRHEFINKSDKYSKLHFE